MRTILIAAAILLTGCVASWPLFVDSWDGQPIDDLIYAWGPPSSAVTLPDGRRTITFSHARSDNAQYCNATFRSDQNGVIVSHTIEGNNGCDRLLADKPPS